MIEPEKEYWDKVAQELDSFYKEERNALRRALNKIFSKGITERVDLTLRECKSVNRKNILDIGCGLGQASNELVKRGARVFSMSCALYRSGSAAKKHEKSRAYVVECTDFLTQVFDEDFDITIALGFFDYVQDPASHLKKMKLLTREKCIMSFPSKFAIQVPIRVLWSQNQKRPVHFYTKTEIKRLLIGIFSRFKIQNISAGYYGVAHV